DIRIIFDGLSRRAAVSGTLAGLIAALADRTVGLRNRVFVVLATATLALSSVATFFELGRHGYLAKEMYAAINAGDVRSVDALLSRGADPQSFDWYDDDYMESDDVPRLIMLAAIRSKWD